MCAPFIFFLYMICTSIRVRPYALSSSGIKITLSISIDNHAICFLWYLWQITEQIFVGSCIQTERDVKMLSETVVGSWHMQYANLSDWWFDLLQLYILFVYYPVKFLILQKASGYYCCSEFPKWKWARQLGNQFWGNQQFLSRE